MSYAEAEPRTSFGPLSSGEGTYDPILVIISAVVVLVFLVIGYYVSRYFRNHQNKK
ncbi:hypothetical protein QPK24_15195 [Paenibacillus polygoni]|uniref:Uncharacterized protein n=1 Tax=Paenibacillus polygoni TaxID=3050112 RepID=A0ABY8WXG3_9BACL|nr:hypothetical protein [Paenibacillus polygoni]WIV17760.1 hypothetical protein QPK24_15195 [Paenibacillus polygoni]